MDLVSIISRYRDKLMQHYAHLLTSNQIHALDSICACRTEHYGTMALECTQCDSIKTVCHSCGNRFCPRCQHHETKTWIERQQTKLIPVNYYMATFTLPFELRAVSFDNQREIYATLLKASAETLSTFAKNDKQFGDQLGMTMVLHTHQRNLQYHPHVHVIIPGCSINLKRKQWHGIKGRYLFKGGMLAAVFRGIFLKLYSKLHLTLPPGVPKKWIVQCKYVGPGSQALTYLARYLYKGVLIEENILRDENGMITFRYKESKTNSVKTRTLKGEDFLWEILQHVLPKGFRRTRDYGFLHGNAKARLNSILILFGTYKRTFKEPERTAFNCPICSCPMRIIEIRTRQLGYG